jgi:hypothetical protein
MASIDEQSLFRALRRLRVGREADSGLTELHIVDNMLIDSDVAVGDQSREYALNQV